MADLGDSPTLNPMQGYGDAGFTSIPKTLGFDQRWLPILQLLQQQQQANASPSGPRPYPKNPLDPNDPNYDPVLDPHNNQYNPNDPRLVGGVSPHVLAHGAPPISGPQQSYVTASNLQGSGDGTSGQALRQTSNYNSTPYNPGPQGTIMNTGAPTQNSGEIVGQGTRGWNIYQTTPSWTGSPLSQAPPARDEGDFKAPSISGPQNPLLQRQAAIRQQIIQQALANIPRGYHFKLG